MKLTRLRTFTAVTFVLLLLLALYVHLSNNTLQTIQASRDTRLDLYNQTVAWVMADFHNYLLADNNLSLQNALSNSHMTPALQQEMFPSTTYNASLYPHYTSLSFIDGQFSLQQQGSFQVYLLVNAYQGSQLHQLNLLVFIRNNLIYNVVAY